MKITVSYYGQLGTAAGVSAEELELPGGSDVAACAMAAAGRHGDGFRRIALDDAGRLRPALLVTVNGTVVDKGKLPVLRDKDAVGFLPAIAGG